MRRYIFYFTVSLLAFGIGIAFVYVYIFKPSNRLESLSELTEEKTVQPLHPNIEVLEKSIAGIKPLSRLEILLLFYKPTVDKWRQGEKIPLVVKPSADIIEQMNELGDRYETAKRLALYETYVPRAIDLNSDGKKELILFQSTPDRTFNDQAFWRLTILEQFNDGIEAIFDEGGMQDYRISKTKTNGYLDLELITEEDPNSVYVEVFRSSGDEYNILSCYLKTFRYQDKNGKWHKYKKPRIEYGSDCC